MTIFFRSDYSQGAHPKVLDAILRSNDEHTDGYGLDRHCEHAAAMIKEMIGKEDCEVHMMVGGTPCNLTFISAALRPYESVIALRSGHAYLHETGGVEATGHRIIAMDGPDGKMTPELIDRAWEEYEDEHTPVPGLVYITQPTEIGTLYSKAEMQAIADKCRERDMLLYVDGARLACALTSEYNDVTIRDLADLCDAFYIGATKNGALFGEALVIMNDRVNDHFRWMIRRQGGLLAKGRLIGVQFEALLEGGENCLLLEIARKENELASKLRKGLESMGVELFGSSKTNQVFPVFPTEVVRELEKDFFFYEWYPEKDGRIVIRLVVSWGTKEEEIDIFLNKVRELIR